MIKPLQNKEVKQIMVGFMEKIESEIVRKIREAPSEEDALKIYRLTEILKSQFDQELVSVKRKTVEKLLNELKISEELKREIMESFKGNEKSDDPVDDKNDEVEVDKSIIIQLGRAPGEKE